MKLRISVYDGFKKFHPILTAERGKSANHLMDEASQTPPINIKPMSDLLDDFGSEILWRSANRCGVFLILQYFGESEVSQLDVAELIDDHILGL